MKAWMNSPGGVPTWPVPVFEVNADGKPIAEVGIAASGVTPVTGAFAATGNSAVFAPIAGRPFFLGIKTTSDWSGVVTLQKSGDAGSTWFDQPQAQSQLNGCSVLAPAGSSGGSFLIEYESGVQYRLACTARTSGTCTYRLSQ